MQRQSGAADACIPPGNLTHDLVCISPVVLTFQLIAPTYSQLIAHSVARLHPLTVRVRLAAGHPRYGSREFRGEVKTISSSLFLQEYVQLKQDEGRRRHHLAVRHSRLSASNSHALWLTPSSPSPLAPNGWHTAVLHWQALCSCTHAKAASWRTALVSPAPDDSRRGSGWGLLGRGLRKAVFHTLSLDFNDHCLYCLIICKVYFHFMQYRMFVLLCFSHKICFKLFFFLQ